MTQDEIIEATKEAGFVTFEGEKGDIEFDTYSFTLAECLTKFAEIILANQAQPTPSQSVHERKEFEPIYQFQDENRYWFDIEESQYKRFSIYNYRIVYPAPQPIPSYDQDVIIKFSGYYWSF